MTKRTLFAVLLATSATVVAEVSPYAPAQIIPASEKTAVGRERTPSAPPAINKNVSCKAPTYLKYSTSGLRKPYSYTFGRSFARRASCAVLSVANSSEAKPTSLSALQI